jgi:hypothetical protein
MTRAAVSRQSLWVAIFAAFALLMQAAGGMGMAQAAPGQTIEICTAHGTKTVTVDQSGQPTAPQQAPCPHCDQCLSPALALMAAAPLTVQPVRYTARAALARTAALRLPPARAPPRPPSQGPPTLLNV